MKRTQTILVAACLASGIFSGARAQVDEIKNEPGYVNLEWIVIPPDADRVTDVSLGPHLVKLVKQAEEQRRLFDLQARTVEAQRERMEARHRELEQKLISMQVKAFGVDSVMARRMRPMMVRMEKELSRKEWTPLIRVKEPGQFTNVSVKYGGDRKVQGVFIMSLDQGQEASFVNLIGDVELDRLRNMLINIDENALDSLRKAASAPVIPHSSKK
jgi:hypothetical protein